MHYEKASAEVITFGNGGFMTTWDCSGSSSCSSDECDENSFNRHYFAARNRR